MNYLTYVKPLKDAGKNNAQTADILASITLRKIGTVDLKKYLTDSGWWENSPNGEFGGLHNAYNDTTNLNANQIEALGRLWSVAFDASNDNAGTELRLRKNGVATNAQPCLQLKRALDASLTHGHIGAQSEIDDFYDLGGGLLFPTAVEQDVADSEAAYNAQLAEQARVAEIEVVESDVMNGFVNPAKSDGTTDGATLRADIKANL